MKACNTIVHANLLEQEALKVVPDLSLIVILPYRDKCVADLADPDNTCPHICEMNARLNQVFPH